MPGLEDTSSLFYIQASQPRFQQPDFDDYEDLSCVLESVCRLDSESLIMRWDTGFCPFNYKYAVSDMSEDILALLTEIQSRESGELDFRWCSDEFRANWLVAWDAADISITATWEDIPFNLAEVFQKLDSRVTMSTSDFLAEWKKPLEVIYQAATSTHFPELNLDRLRDVMERIPYYGVLYR